MAAMQVKSLLPRHFALKGITMLVLTRKLGDKILIGENITITVVSIEHGKVRLGIEAPQ